MLRLFFLSLLLLPFAELALLVYLGRRIGLLETIGLTMLTSMIGVALAKQQGLRVLKQVQRAHSEGRVPEEGLISTLFVLVGAGFLLLPGFLSDALGLLLLLPPTRKVLAGIVRRAVERGLATGRIQVMTPRPPPPPGVTIDVLPPDEKP